MDFGLSEDQEMLKTTVRRFLEEQCPTERVREVMESDNGHDETLWRSLAELGVTAISVPADYDGLGSEFLDAAIVSEEIGRAAAPGPFFAHVMAVLALAEGDDSEAKQSWLPRMAAGNAIVSVAIGEAKSEWAAESLAASYATNGTLSGTKPLVPYADVADAFVVAAREGDDAGIFLVETKEGSVTSIPLKSNDMTRRLHHVEFKSAPARRLGGRELFERVIDAGCVLLAADAYGGASRCLEMTRSYALERSQFGQVIGGFQGVKHQLADLAAELEPSMSLYWYAAHAFDSLKDQAPKNAALAKAHLADVFEKVARVSTELHGGIGFTWEFDLQLWFRRALFDRSFLGDATFHRERAARHSDW